MEVNSYFLDTYSLIEIVKSNPHFEKFRRAVNFTSLMNLLELNYIISKEFSQEKADKIIEKLKDMCLEINIEDVKRASDFRLKNIKKKLSYIDCLGYAIAYNRKMKFLTGDKEFKGMKNVEFVK